MARDSSTATVGEWLRGAAGAPRNVISSGRWGVVPEGILVSQGLVDVFDPADFFAEAKILVGIFDPAGSAVALGGGTTTTVVVAVLRSAARDGCAGGPVMQQCRLWTPPLPMGTTCSSSIG